MKNLRSLIYVAVAVALAAVIVSRCYDDRLSEWEERAASALAVAEEQRARVAVLREEADSLRSQAADLAADAAARAPVTDSVIVTLPPPRTPAEFQRDTVISRLVVERDDFEEAYTLEVAAHAKTREALDVAMLRGDSLVAVLEDRPSERPWFIPRVGIGPGVGLNGFDVQVHLSWELKIGG